jgi:hypothetical protein
MCCGSLKRRHFLGWAAGVVAGVHFTHRTVRPSPELPALPGESWNPDRPFHTLGKQLRVQPVLMYQVSQRCQQTSWKSWGGVQSESAAAEEVERISRELEALSETSDFPLEIQPLIKVTTLEQAALIQRRDSDVVLLYPATGSGRLLRSCLLDDRDSVIFVRHRSGPVYYWYEALSVKYLRSDRSPPEVASARVSVEDVVVDDYGELVWRLRALFGVKNFTGTKIIAVGGAMGKYAPEAPQVASKKHGIEIIEVSYPALEPRIQKALSDRALRSKAERWAARYLSIPQTTLSTEKSFVVNAFLLYIVFKDLMREHGAPAFTIKECMSTIMPMSKTTACLTLSLLNDEGPVAFCESDFVVIPAGILLRYICGKPVFLHNSTFPHQAVVTCAHCSAPRRMDAIHYEPCRIMTHYESEYGAAPKVQIPIGQEVTFLDPEYCEGRWVGFKGIVESNPLYEICRSQQDVKILGDWKRLIHEVRDSHWIMAYGDYLREVGYVAPRIGIEWETISKT